MPVFMPPLPAGTACRGASPGWEQGRMTRRKGYREEGVGAQKGRGHKAGNMAQGTEERHMTVVDSSHGVTSPPPPQVPLSHHPRSSSSQVSSASHCPFFLPGGREATPGRGRAGTPESPPVGLKSF